MQNAAMSLGDLLQHLVDFLFSFRAPRETLHARELRAVLDTAWLENYGHQRLAYAKGFVRQRFNEVVGAYIRGYHERTGELPRGWHQVGQGSMRLIYFSGAHASLPSESRSSAS